MKSKTVNGNGKFKTVADFKGEKIKFPVTYHLKAVMEGTENEKKHKEELVRLFDVLEIKYQYRYKKFSSKGAYVSFTYEITLTGKQQMNDLYAGLKKIKAVKFAL